jgi:hypothetical protein
LEVDMVDQIEDKPTIEENNTEDSEAFDWAKANRDALSALYEKKTDAELSSPVVAKRFKWWWLLLLFILLTILILFRFIPSQRVAIGLLGIALIIFSVLWRGPRWQVAHLKKLKPEERFQQENEARKTLAQIIGGIVLIGGLYYTGESTRIAQKSADDTQKAATESSELTRQGQITERFTKAVEQLGRADIPNKENNLAIRLGGIYALERVANESKEYHWPIMELLTAYVRQNAPRKLNDPNYELKADIKAILTVLGRRKIEYETESQRLDLSGTNLSGLQLKDANLDRVMFNGADLTGATFIKGQMENASFVITDLTSAAFLEIDLKGSTFNIKLSGSRFFPKTIFKGTNFTDCDLSDVRGFGCKDIEGADLYFHKRTVPPELEKCGIRQR